jgi:ketosteroid isomerase-like protein
VSESSELGARVRRLEDLMDIHQLFVDYGEHLDSGDFEAYSQLFAEDGEVLLGPMGRATGRESIKELMIRQLSDKVGTTFHIISSPRVTLDGDSATATVMWSVAVTGDDGMARLSMVGHHLDVLTRTPEGWKIKRRKGVMNLPIIHPDATR